MFHLIHTPYFFLFFFFITSMIYGTCTPFGLSSTTIKNVAPDIFLPIIMVQFDTFSSVPNGNGLETGGFFWFFLF